MHALLEHDGTLRSVVKQSDSTRSQMGLKPQALTKPTDIWVASTGRPKQVLIYIPFCQCLTIDADVGGTRIKQVLSNGY